MRIRRTLILPLFLLAVIFTSCKKDDDTTNPIVIGDANMIIDHLCTDLSKIPADAINTAKENLHIAYGHTSHGSQLTTGMNGLEDQTTLIGMQGDIYQWHDGPVDGELDLDDYFVSGDLGNPDRVTWEARTRSYLEDNPDVNVIMWSWCGQVSSSSEEDINTYLSLMNGLENSYRDIKFVYMTGHADIGRDEDLKARNKQIRDYCEENNKILFDFFDIERYDPDGTYYEFVSDNCNYYSSVGLSLLGNWATEWQESHTEGVDWYTCSSAHSEPLNANRKAYAAWWLFARLAGWNGQ